MSLPSTLPKDRANLKIAGGYLVSLATLALLPALQFVSFILSGRILGLEAFGHLIVFQASAAIFVEVAGAGMSEALIRNVARDPLSYRQSLLDFGLIAIPSTLVAIAVNTAVQGWLFAASGLFLLAALFGAVDILTMRVQMLWEQVAIAHRDMRKADAIKITPAILRLASVGSVYLSGADSLTVVAFAYMSAGSVGALLTTYYGLKSFGSPSGERRWRAVEAGIPFALNQLLRASQYNLDRLVLSLVLSAPHVAIYAAAMKFVQFGLLPVATMLRMWYPRMFEAGHHSLVALRTLANKLLPIVLLAAGLSAMAIMVGAPLVPMIMGEEFLPSVDLLITAAPSLLLVAAAYVGADLLTGSGKPYVRVGFFALAVGLQTSAAFLLCPIMGPMGAVLAFYLSSGVFALCCWLAVFSAR